MDWSNFGVIHMYTERTQEKGFGTKDNVSIIFQIKEVIVLNF